jgi:hypothetical protein
MEQRHLRLVNLTAVLFAANRLSLPMELQISAYSAVNKEKIRLNILLSKLTPLQFMS